MLNVRCGFNKQEINMSDDRNQVYANSSRIIALETRLDIMISNLKELIHELNRLDAMNDEEGE